MSIATAVQSQSLALVNGTRELGHPLTSGLDLSGTTVLVSGWAQLAVCILIVVLCCCFTLLCLCTSCICCTNNVEEGRAEVGGVAVAVIQDKPPSYDEAQRTSTNGLPSYQEALRRESQISWIYRPTSDVWSPHRPAQTPDYVNAFQYR